MCLILEHGESGVRLVGALPRPKRAGLPKGIKLTLLMSPSADVKRQRSARDPLEPRANRRGPCLPESA